MRQQQLATQRLQDVKACTEQRSLRMTNFQIDTESISTFNLTNSSHIEELRQKKAFQCIATKILTQTGHAHKRPTERFVDYLIPRRSLMQVVHKQ